MYSPYNLSGNTRQQTTGYFPQQQQQQQPFQQQATANPPYNLQQNAQSSLGNGLQFGSISAPGMESNINPGLNNMQQTGNFAQPSQYSGAFTGTSDNRNNVPAGSFSNFNSSNYQHSHTQQQTQPVQSQGTGYYNIPFGQPQLQQQQSQHVGLQQQHTGFGQTQVPQQPLLPQQTGFYMQSSQQPIEPLKPNATGFVNSFANNGINNDVKIPVRRLSFITANDQAKFERLFRSMVPKASNTISGNDCRKILMKSGLQPSQLARIWSLCDSSKAGELLFPEFALAMHLVNSVLQGDSIPYELDTKTKNEVSSFIDAINLSIASESTTDLTNNRTPFDDLLSNGFTGLQPQPTGMMPQTSFGMPLQTQATGSGLLNPMSTGYMPQTSFGIPAQITGGPLPNTNIQSSLQPQNTGYLSQTFNAPLNSQTTGGITMNGQSTGSLGQEQLGAFQSQVTNNFNVNRSSLQPQNTGNFSQGLQSQNTGSLNNSSSLVPGAPQMQPTSFSTNLQPQTTGTRLQQQTTGGFNSVLNPQMTGNPPVQQPQLTGGVPNVSFQQQATGGYSSNFPQPPSLGTLPQTQSTGGIVPLQTQQTGYLPPSGFNPTMPLTAQKTGFGNNEIYSQSNLGSNFTAQNEDSITAEEKALFYKIFETYDSENKGLLDALSAVEIFRKSGLNRGDLERIWALCDINNNGKLNKQEFALGMHLVYRKLNGFELPSRLPLNLIPSSRKILDNVKDQLKNTQVGEDKKKATKTDALSFRNNDEEEVLPSFRNRRKVFNTSVASTSSPTPQGATISGKSDKELENKNRERANQLRRAIAVKRDRIRSERAKKVNPSADDFDRIKSLKSKIRCIERGSEVQNAVVPSDFKQKFDAIMRKLPHVFFEITEVDGAISNAKIELFRLKNPSCLVGSGPNGELTEEDRRKAKSKALLKSRMDALTGKAPSSTDSFEAREAQYNAEISRIRAEGDKNMGIISDIRKSIAEISASLTSNLNGGGSNTQADEFEKWELGAGLEPDVRSFVNDLKSSASPQERRDMSQQKLNYQTNIQSQPFDNPVDESNVHGLALANSSSYEVKKPKSEVSPATTHSTVIENNNEDSDDDAEEKKLQEKLRNLKLRKKEEKERRLAELRRQIEEAQAESSDSDDTTSVAVQEKSTNDVSVPFAISNAQSTSVPLVTSQRTVDSTSNGDRNPFFKQKISTTSSFDLKAAETQRRLQRGLDHDDDDDWSDDEPQKPQRTNEPANKNGNVESAEQHDQGLAIAGNKTYATSSDESAVDEKRTDSEHIVPGTTSAPETSNPQAAAVPVATSLPNIQSSFVTPPVPIAPPLPQINGAAGVPPMPIAPPLPEVNASDNAPPVPVAAPLPQIGTTASFMAPPPPLPSYENVQPIEEGNSDNDSDDMLSIPDSVASDEHFVARSGIPPPPPLPSM